MFRVTTIREHAGRAGRYISVWRAALPGPLGLLLQFVVLTAIVAAIVLLALPFLALGALFLVGGLLYAGGKMLLRAGRLKLQDDGRRNVRVIEQSEQIP